jgi:DNA sulfur modification protein DndD
LVDELRALRDEQRRIEVDLQRAPDDDVLAPIHSRILELTTLLAEGQRRQIGLSERLGAMQFQRDEQARKLQRAAEQLAEAQAVEHEMALAERSKLVLTAYRDALIRQRLSALEEALVACFNAICRKEHLLTSVRIDPDGFSVQLRGINDQPLNLETFSAGERQLYSLALLWAMRQVSGRSLPLAIDSPLARLDETHRQLMVQGYIPAR